MDPKPKYIAVLVLSGYFLPAWHLQGQALGCIVGCHGTLGTLLSVLHSGQWELLKKSVMSQGPVEAGAEGFLSALLIAGAGCSPYQDGCSQQPG